MTRPPRTAPGPRLPLGAAHRLLALGLVAASLLGTAGAVQARSDGASVAGLTVLGRTELSPRLHELELRTDALARPTRVRVLLPAGYDRTSRRYPVLYLLNGGAGSYRDWTELGAAERLTAGEPMVIVMPDGGTGGNYTDWYASDGSGVAPRWESYHLRQLLPFVDATYRTLARRDQRAVAGPSMGGNGSLHYAARHPDLFVAAASFSGANDVFHPVIRPITETTGMADGALPGAVFGPSVTEELRWRGSNPVDLAANLAPVAVHLAWGDGRPGGPGGEAGVDLTETAVAQTNETLRTALTAAGVDHTVDAYGPGAHTWTYWQRELADWLPDLRRVLAERRPAPARVTHWSAEASYALFGWRVSFTRDVAESSRLVGAGRTGFTLEGSGRATVTTPATYPVGRPRRVVVTDAAGTRTLVVRPDRTGRLTLTLDLGPSNTVQQFSPASLLVPTVVRQARVTVS